MFSKDEINVLLHFQKIDDVLVRLVLRIGEYDHIVDGQLERCVVVLAKDLFKRATASEQLRIN